MTPTWMHSTACSRFDEEDTRPCTCIDPDISIPPTLGARDGTADDPRLATRPPSRKSFYSALGQRTENGIESIFNAPAVTARQKARIARGLEDFLGAYPMDADE